MNGDGRGVWRRLTDTAARLRRRWRGVEPRTRVGIRCDRVAHGGWWICPQAIRAGDVAYSFGVSGDLGFERALAERYGARVYAFDPDPATVERAEAAGVPEGVRLFPLSVGGRDARAVVPLAAGGRADAKVLRLASHMRLLGHRRLDLIRLDVPGAEADVIRDLVGMDVDVHQLLLRFREDETPEGRDRIETAVGALGEHGYRVFHISPDRRRFSLIRTDFAAS
jgi:hypothetical protein